MIQKKKGKKKKSLHLCKSNKHAPHSFFNKDSSEAFWESNPVSQAGRTESLLFGTGAVQ
jgi:hypothetical protein